jgi:hypothetical protein
VNKEVMLNSVLHPVPSETMFFVFGLLILCKFCQFIAGSRSFSSICLSPSLIYISFQRAYDVQNIIEKLYVLLYILEFLQQGSDVVLSLIAVVWGGR